MERDVEKNESDASENQQGERIKMQSPVDQVLPYGQMRGSIGPGGSSGTPFDQVGDVGKYARIPNSTFDALALVETTLLKK
jgi:hypothetical protein